MIRLKSWQWFILATPLITIIAFFAIGLRSATLRSLSIIL